MALFKNEDAPCPICGQPTARLLPMKVEGKPICKECRREISMQSDMLETLTLASLREHLKYRKQNQEILKTFVKSVTAPLGGCLDPKLQIDKKNKRWYIEDGSNPPVFSFAELRGFDVIENSSVIESGSASGYKRAENANPTLIALVTALSTLTGASAEKLECPVRELDIKFYLTNKYWKEYELGIYIPSFESDNPAKFVTEYNKLRDTMSSSLQALHLAVFGAAASTQPTAQTTQQPAAENASAASVAAEIKQYKELLDCGAITQEEYDKKKKQLLGL